MASEMDPSGIQEREAAAMKLQAHFRGMKARTDLKKKREEAYKARSEAAVVLQSQYRGYRARKEYKRRREELTNQEEKQEDNMDSGPGESRMDNDVADDRVVFQEMENEERKKDTKSTTGEKTDDNNGTYMIGSNIEDASLEEENLRGKREEEQNSEYVQREADAKRRQTERMECEAEEEERPEAETVEVEEQEADRLEAERLEEKRLETRRQEAERLETERLEAERLEAETEESKRLEAERIEAERLKAERVEAERLEAQRVETERQETERLETERVETERLETERQETERLEAERLNLEATRQKAERLKAKRLEPREQETERLVAGGNETGRQDSQKEHTERDNLEEKAVEAKRVKKRAMQLEKQRSKETMGSKRKREEKEAAARMIQKNYRGYITRRNNEKHEKEQKHGKSVPLPINPPMLSQQIVDEVTRAMALIMNHSAGTLTNQQIERTNTLKDKPVRQLQRWKQPKPIQPVEIETETEQKEDTSTGIAIAKATWRMPRRNESMSIWSLKSPSLQPHPLKKPSNYLRTYLRAAGKPVKASANIRLRFKSSPKQQPPELTDIWDIKKRHVPVGQVNRQSHSFGKAISLANTAPPALDSHAPAYRHSLSEQPWAMSSYSPLYGHGSPSGLYSNAVMSDWMAGPPLLQHLQSHSADSDVSTWTGTNSLNVSPPLKRDISQNEVYSDLSTNRWVGGRSDRPTYRASNQLEPLHRTTNRWVGRSMQAKKTPSVGYAARYKDVADAQR